MSQLFRRFSAWLPIAMSFIALVLLVTHLITAGTGRQSDEGATAHLFQLLIAGQLPLIAYFAIKWFPRERRFASRILALHALAAVAALAPVFYYHL